jgi:adenosylhomocysteine nucleosidase
MIGIIGAMDIEVESLKRLLKDVRKEKISNIEFFLGKIGETETVIAKCGVGKVFAAICAQTMILHFKPDVIVNIGVAGGLSDNLNIGDIVIADSVAQHDMDTTALGDARGFLTEIELVKIPADRNILAVLEDSCRYAGINYEVGTIASGDQFVSSEDKKQFIKDTFSAKACEMEGAAIGQVCFVNKVPFGVLRAISDGANGGANFDFAEFTAMAAENSAKVIERFVYTLKR